MAGRETEMKLLAVSGEQLAAIGRLATVAGAAVRPAGEGRQEDLYVDTEDFRLHRAGLSLRYRVRDDGAVLTLKEVPSASRRPLLADREEVEETLAEMPEDPGAVPAGPISRRIAALVSGHPLRPVARLVTERERRHLVDGENPAAELCLDRVSVRDAAGAEPLASFFEVEVEDLGGGPEFVTRAGEELRGLEGLLPSPLSKLERALAARGLLARARGEEREYDTAVRRSDRFVDAAYRVFRRHFERMRANEPGTRLGEDPEFLHDMRVSTRRLRAAFRTFGPCFPDRALSGHNRNLRRIARVLGEVRDLDVYLGRLPEYAAMLPEDERGALAPFEAWLRRRRGRAREAMLRYLDTKGYAAFLDRFDRFLERGAPKRPSRVAARTPAPEAAPRRIRKALSRVLDAGRAIPAKNPPAEDLHRLRIHVKRLRYACEFFSDLYGGEMKRFVRTTVALQDLLGAHQDACVAGDVLRRFAARLPAGRRDTVRTALALGRLIASQDLSAAHAREGFRRTFAAFDDKKARKRLLRRP